MLDEQMLLSPPPNLSSGSMFSATSNKSSTSLTVSSNTTANPSRATQLLTNIFGRGSGKDSSPPYPDVILRVQILSCNNLAAKDRNGYSDPFVIVSGLGGQFRTPVCKCNLDPVYEPKDATFNFPIHAVHKLGVLKFVVWDKDLIKNDYLGEYALPVVQWFKGTAFAFGDPNNEPFSFCLVSSLPTATVRGTMCIKVGFVHHPNSTSRPDFEETYNALTNNSGIIVLEISGAKDLPKWPNMTYTGWDMDPFVEVSIGEEVVRTCTIQHSRDPVWHKQLLFHVREDDPSLTIRLTVFDQDTFTFNDYVGEAEVDIATLVEGGAKKDPNTGLYPDVLPAMLEFERPLIPARRPGRVYEPTPTITFRACYQSYGVLRQQLRQGE